MKSYELGTNTKLTGVAEIVEQLTFPPDAMTFSPAKCVSGYLTERVQRKREREKKGYTHTHIDTHKKKTQYFDGVPPLSLAIVCPTSSHTKREFFCCCFQT